jgi:hypothetical protein
MYMAPEQAKGETELDHLTDQWALACITYEMLAGRPPYLGDDTSALLYQVVHQAPPRLANFVKDLPPEVERVVQRALAKNPGERFPDVTAFARALEAAATGRPLPIEHGREATVNVPGVSLTPVEVAPTLAGNAANFALRPENRAAKSKLAAVAVWILAVGAIGFGVFVVVAPSPRRPPLPATPVAGPAPGEAPPAPTADPTAAAPAGEQAAPAQPDTAEPAAADDTDNAPGDTGKKHGVRRRPARRVAAAKHAAPAADSATPTTPVKRKLINQL